MIEQYQHLCRRFSTSRDMLEHLSHLILLNAREPVHLLQMIADAVIDVLNATAQRSNEAGNPLSHMGLASALIGADT